MNRYRYYLKIGAMLASAAVAHAQQAAQPAQPAQPIQPAQPAPAAVPAPAPFPEPRVDLEEVHARIEAMRAEIGARVEAAGMARNMALAQADMARAISKNLTGAPFAFAPQAAIENMAARGVRGHN